MSLKIKILLLAILPLILVASLNAVIMLNQARTLTEEEIQTFQKNLLASRKRELRNYINLALNSIEHIVQNKNITEENAQQRVKLILNSLTYGDDGYFFVYDQTGINLVHPVLSQLVGKNLYDMQDASGNFVIRSLLQIAQQGGGFHRYLWNKPSTGKNEEKLSYVVQIPRWKWMIGTGVYIDDISQDVVKVRAQVNSNIHHTFITMLEVIAGTVIIIALTGIAINIRESKLADKKLRDLIHKSVRFQVNERRRFSRELHDGINQLMVSVKFRIESALDKLHKGKNNVDDDLNSAKKVLNDAIQEVRRVSHDLRPRLLDEMGLKIAIENLLGQITERTQISIKLYYDLPSDRLTEDIEITLYRIIQEALINVERYAGPCNVEIRLKLHEDTIQLVIKDDGHGFNAKELNFVEGIGISNMRERVELFGGKFSYKTKPDEGVKLKAFIPNDI
jgi:two-component system, NarL family, sensor kinase